MEYIVDEEVLREKFPLAKKDSHKKQNGILSVVAGSGMMVGAPIFNLLAASAVGSGYIYATINKDLLAAVGVKCPWVVFRDEFSIKDEQVILIGSGCDLREDFDEVFLKAIQANKKLVIDAYGLKRLTDLKPKPTNTTVLTPHIGEFAYMSGKSIQEIKNNKEELAKAYAKENNVILVLKDSESIVSDGENVYRCNNANPALAKAGSGDVLAGCIAGLLSRMDDSFLAVCLAVYLHNLAAHKACTHLAISVISPLDIIEEIKKILFEIGK